MKTTSLILRIAAPIVVFAVLGASALAGSREVVDAQPAPPVYTQSPAEVLANQHGCWSGDAPADMVGKIPGHVVVVKDGRAVYGGARLVGAAMDQIFNDKPHGLTVIAFCR